MKRKAYRNNWVINKFFIGFLFFQVTVTCYAIEPNWEDYNALLHEYVSVGKIDGVHLNVVNYNALRKDPLYQKILTQIQSFNIQQLSDRKEKLAYYINAYNILAIKMVIDHWPVKSIKDAGNWFYPVWKRDAGIINHHTVSLDYLENQVLRKMGEPRIHMAIVCASVSCPDLRNEAYTAKKLSSQLDDQALSFFNNSNKGLRLKGNEIDISKIFDWFKDDFNKVGGVIAFVKKYRKDLPDNVHIEGYMDYNWNLNNK